MIKLSLEELLIPLFVSFFMSGIHIILTQFGQHDFLLATLVLEWGKSWALTYPFLLILIPFSKTIVKKLLSYTT